MCVKTADYRKFFDNHWLLYMDTAEDILPPCMKLASSDNSQPEIASVQKQEFTGKS
jgi:hypothetical protein